MPIAIQEFYSPWPQFGVNLSTQYPLLRDNHRSLATINRASFVDLSPFGPDSNALAYTTFGEFSFPKRFRNGYDKDNDRYAIQYNINTNVDPVWVDYLTIDQDGNVEFSGNFYTAALEIQSTSSGSPVIEGVRRLKFNGTDFYITFDSAGRPIINSTGQGGSGTVNSASNIGSGTGLFAQKVGTDLQFKTLLAGSNITINSDADEVTISSTAQSAFYLDNIGTGQPLVAGTFSDHSNIRTLVAGSNITITKNANNLTIASTAQSAFYLDSAGTGAKVLRNNSADSATLRSIIAGSNILVQQNANDITISATGVTPGANTAYTQSFNSAVEWVATHNFGTNNVTFDVYDNQDVSLIPGRADVSDINTAYFYFSSPKSGKVVLLSAGIAPNQLFYVNNVGSGVKLVRDTVSGSANIRSLIAGTNITLQQNANDITISASGGSSSFYLDSSGSGARVLRNNATGSATLRSIVAGTNISVVQNSNDITISSTAQSAFYLDNVGTGAKIVQANFSDHSNIRTLIGTSPVTVTQNANNITIGSTALTSFYLDNLGSGAHVVKGNFSDHSNLRSIVAGTGIQVTQNANDITIAATGSSSAFYLDSVGNGAKIVQANFSDHSNIRTLLGAGGTTVTQNANNITITSNYFYGIVFKTSGPNPHTERDDTLVFDANFFYLDNAGNDGKPLVSFIPESIITTGTARELLKANRTYFVATTGSDSNNGLSSASPFLTIQKAINTAYTIDISQFTCEIKIANGTYNADILVDRAFTGKVQITGDTTTPANVVLNGTTNALYVIGPATQLYVRGVKFTSGSVGLIVEQGAFCDVNGNTEFGACTGIQVYSNRSGLIIFTTSAYRISGNAVYHVALQNNSLILNTGLTVTLTGTPAFSGAYALCDLGSAFQANAMVFSGSATGSRFDVKNLSYINTSGGGANYFPGNAAGTTSGATFGLYL